MSRSPESRRRRIRTLLTPAFDNLPSRAYLVLAAAAIGVFLYAAYVLRDTSFAGIWPILVTLPFGLLAAPLPALVWDTPLEGLGSGFFIAGTIAAGLTNAVMLGHLVRTLRRRIWRTRRTRRA